MLFLKSICTSLFIFLTFLSFGQNKTDFPKIKVKGIIIDKVSQKPLEYATITLTHTKFPKIIGGGITNNKGEFEASIPAGSYNIKAEFISFKPFIISERKLTANTTLETIALEEDYTQLQEVNVRAEKSYIEIKLDKKVYTVGQDLIVKGGTVSDVLDNIPSVQVDVEGKVSLRGNENVTILIDGKPSNAVNIAEALKIIPADAIDKVEVITNPSSKYEAQGMSGILNIILKKDRKAGYNATINAGIAAPYRLNGGFNINANIKKWNVFANANARQSQTWEETTTARSNFDNNFTYSSFTHNDRKPLNGFINIGADYSFNKNNKITLSENVFNAKMRGSSLNTIENQIDYQALVSKQRRTNNYVGNPLSSTTNLQYKHNFKKIDIE
jgi:hypothetical protein